MRWFLLLLSGPRTPVGRFAFCRLKEALGIFHDLYDDRIQQVCLFFCGNLILNHELYFLVLRALEAEFKN